MQRTEVNLETGIIRILDVTPEYMASLPAPTPAPKIKTVTMRQCQLALLSVGLLDQVDQIIAAQARAVRVTWATAGTVDRANPLISSLAGEMGLSDMEIDALFEQAALL